MQIRTLLICGLTLMVAGVGTFGAWNHWRNTRNFEPVNVPLPLSSGQSISPRFKLNFDGLYLIETDAPGPTQPTWVLSKEGHEIKRGNSQDSNAETRVIGDFQGKAGEEYELQVTSGASPSSSVADAQPRLKVAVASIAYTDLQSSGVLVFSMAFICELFGLILLGVAFYKKRKAAGKTSA
jgi:hypothetical protein